MARKAQAFGECDRRLFHWFSPGVGLCLLGSLTLAGCGTKGFSIESAIPDRTIVTGSIPPQATPADTVRMSDEAIIRAAVSSAIVDEIDDNGLGWANAETGSRGTIRDVSEARQAGYLCRRFMASRESFEGVHMYRGETCLGSERVWVTKSFDRLQ